MPKIKIFILNWNGGDILLDCIQSTLNIDYESFEVIVIDNKSSDNSINDIHEKFPQVQVISLDQNYGYSAGYNKAFESVGCSRDEFFMLLNNDTIVDKNILKNFIITYQELNSKDYIFGAKIYYMNNKNLIWYAGGKVNLRKGIIKHINIRRKELNKNSLAVETDYITGCCLFTHAQNIKKLGGFDEKFNMYCEDVDFSLRALKLKIKPVYVPKAIL